MTTTGFNQTINSINFNFTSTNTFTLGNAGSGNPSTSTITFNASSLATGSILISLGSNFSGRFNIQPLNGGNKALSLKLANSGSITVTNGSAVLDISTIIRESAAGKTITKNGSGRLILSGANEYSGGTTISAGTLELGSGDGMGTGNVTLSGGALDLAVDSGLTAYNLSVTANSTIAANRAANGAGLTHTLGILAIGANTLTLVAGGSITSGTAGVVFGATTLSGNAIFDTATNTSLTLGAIATSANSLTKQGNGLLVVGTASSRTGTTAINGGTVRVQNATALGSGQITVGTGSLEIAAISLTSPSLTLNNGATLLGTGAASYTKSNNPVIGDGASVTLATSASGDTLTIGSGYANAASSAATPTVNIANPGGGRVILNGGANGFRGNWVVQSGTLQTNAANNVFGIGNVSGSLTGSTVALSGGNLELRGASGDLTYNAGTPGAEVPMKFNSSGTVAAGRSANGAGVTHTFGALTLGNNSNVNATFTNTASVTSGTSGITFGAVTLNGNATVTVNKPTSGVVSQVTFGAVGETGGTRSLTKAGPGLLLMSAAGSYGGDTSINEGTLALGNVSAIPSGSGKGNVVLNGGSVAGILDLAGLSPTVNGLAGTTGAVLGQVLNSTPSTIANFTVGANNVTSSFAGVIKDNGGTGGTVRLTKTGTGALTLAGANTYTGTTNVNNGVLRVNGSLSSGGGLVTVSATTPDTATLGGTGSVNRNVTIGDRGQIAPGSADFSLSNLNINQAGTTTSFDDGGAYAWQVNSLPASGTAGTNWDKLTLNSLSIDATSGNKFTIKVITLNGAGTAAGSLTGVSTTFGTQYTWVIATAASFSGFDFSKFQVDTSGFSANQDGMWGLNTSGGNLELTMTVPEPTAATTLAVLTGLAGLRRPRNRIDHRILRARSGADR